MRLNLLVVFGIRLNFIVIAGICCGFGPLWFLYIAAVLDILNNLSAWYLE